MLKKAIVVTSAAIALSVSLSAPASARANFGGQQQQPVRVPEPTTILGLMAFAGGGLLAKNRLQSNK